MKYALITVTTLALSGCMQDPNRPADPALAGKYDYCIAQKQAAEARATALYNQQSRANPVTDYSTNCWETIGGIQCQSTGSQRYPNRTFYSNFQGSANAVRYGNAVFQQCMHGG